MFFNSGEQLVMVSLCLALQTGCPLQSSALPVSQSLYALWGNFAASQLLVTSPVC